MFAAVKGPDSSSALSATPFLPATIDHYLLADRHLIAT